MKHLFTILICCCCIDSVAQQSDFIVLKKKNRTIKSFYTGTPIEFETIYGSRRTGIITEIRNDSIFLREYITRQVMTQMGFYVIDTAGSVSNGYPYRDIRSLASENKGFNWQASGLALITGSIVLTLSSGVVFLVDRDKFSPELLAGAVGLGIAGYFIFKASRQGIVIGKRKYRLEYIRLTGK